MTSNQSAAVGRDHVPAVVHDYGGRRAAVTHPDGDHHPNAVATRRRLLDRGYAIVPFRGSEAPTIAEPPRPVASR